MLDLIYGFLKIYAENDNEYVVLENITALPLERALQVHIPSCIV
jgi:hypothetical protein